MKHLLTFLICSLISFASLAQDKYWITFADKGDLSRYEACELLSPDALENRRIKGIPLDERDFPVHEAYFLKLKEMGIQLQHRSRWLNAVSARLYPGQLEAVASQEFVQSVFPVRTGITAKWEELCGTEEETLDTYRHQLAMIGLDALHANRLTGKGVKVAVFDNGFRNVDQLEGFSHIFKENRILATRDFVDGDEDVFGSCSGTACRHGTSVFSILAARMPDSLLGSAPDASFILLRTEEDLSETHQEEDNWVAAAEYADSLGAQVFSTSLGYRLFDPGEGDYLPEDIDGNTAIITIAADIAASKGIVVVNSAGNEGAAGVNTPADGFLVIAAGSVNQDKVHSSFSSTGPTFDGRIKPDVCAMGETAFYMSTSGQVFRGNGTSFAAPLISGLMACLIQAKPEATREALYDALYRSADRYQNPNNLFGYGIPDGTKAYRLLTGESLPVSPIDRDLLLLNNVILFPNPNFGSFNVAIQSETDLQQVRIELLDNAGRLIWTGEDRLIPEYNQIEIRPANADRFAAGLYHLLIRDSESGEPFFTGKVAIQNP
jgi:hypothetical protein